MRGASRVRCLLGALARSLPPLLIAFFCGEVLHLWRAHDGFTLTSADDATRLLIADAFGRYGVWPVHWTWPPLPMLVDGLLIPDGGDLLPRAIALRAAMMAGTALLLGRFWSLVFRRTTSLPGSEIWTAALWLLFPINVRLALSGLSEPYLYLLLAIGKRPTNPIWNAAPGPSENAPRRCGAWRSEREGRRRGSGRFAGFSASSIAAV